jgi:N-acetylgalactosamine kinase
MAKHEELPIPIYNNLEPVYGGGSSLEEAQLRFDILKSKFKEFFGHTPQLFARSPGSIPLIPNSMFNAFVGPGSFIIFTRELKIM